MMRTRGVISLLFGLAYVTVYQAVDASWGLLFSLMGYASLLKGTVLLWYPQRGQTKYKMLYNSKAKAIIIGVAIVGVSAVLARIALAKI